MSTILCALHFVHYTALHYTSPYGSAHWQGTPQPQRNTHVTAIWGHKHNPLVCLYFSTYMDNTLVTAIWIRHTSLSWTELLKHNDASNCTTVHTLSTDICTSVHSQTSLRSAQLRTALAAGQCIHCQRHLHCSALISQLHWYLQSAVIMQYILLLSGLHPAQCHIWVGWLVGWSRWQERDSCSRTLSQFVPLTTNHMWAHSHLSSCTSELMLKYCDILRGCVPHNPSTLSTWVKEQIYKALNAPLSSCISEPWWEACPKKRPKLEFDPGKLGALKDSKFMDPQLISCKPFLMLKAIYKGIFPKIVTIDWSLIRAKVNA